jgi:hypothetical protein
MVQDDCFASHLSSATCPKPFGNRVYSAPINPPTILSEK